MALSSKSDRHLVSFNITASNGTTNHNNQQILCTPATWTDILSFFLSNYFTHVATVVNFPGESNLSTVVALVSALLVPTSGISRGLTAIVRKAKLAKKPLNVAARAGALCMVVRSDSWTFCNGDEICNAILRAPLVDKQHDLTGFEGKVIGMAESLIKRIIDLPAGLALPRDAMRKKLEPYKQLDPYYRWNTDSSAILRIFWPSWISTDFSYWRFYDTNSGVVDKTRTVHGSYKLVEGYRLAYVPSDADVLPNAKGMDPNACDISASYNLPKAITAIIQLLFALTTLYRASGPQVDHYGFSAYALTVTPYAVMSLINLLGAMLTPSYPALYMISSDVMHEAMRRGAEFDGVVGHLVQEDPSLEGERYDCFGGEVKFYQNLDTSQPTVHTNSPSNSVLSRTINFVKVFRKFPQPNSRPLHQSAVAPASLKFNYSFENNVNHELVKYRSLEREGILGKLAGPGLPLSICDDCSTSATILIPACSNFRRQNPRKWQYNPIEFNLISTVATMRTILTQKHEETPQQIADICSWTVSLASVVIYGGISGFRSQESTRTQRLVTMIWLALGVIVGPTFVNYMAILTSWANDIWGKGASAENRNMKIWSTVLAYFMLPFYGAASIAGFVVVGKMIKEWGSCIELYQA